MKAIYNCVADNPDELTFSEGEVIVVDGEEDQEWWVSIPDAGVFEYLQRVVRIKHTKLFPVQVMPRSGPMDAGARCNHGSQSRKP